MNASDRDIAVIVNRSSGRGHEDELAARIKADFAAAGKQIMVNLVAANDLKSAVEQARREGFRRIVAGGGDGTISTAASVLADTDVDLGVLPLGTLNHFAKDLHIPLDLAGAVRTIVDGHTERIDVGDINGRIFINNTSLGFYPDLVRFRDRQRRRFGIGKWAALAWATLLVMRRERALAVRLETDTDGLECRTFFAFVGNNEYVLEGLNIGVRATLKAGVLSLYTTRHADRFAVWRLALRALSGRLRGAADFDALTAKRIVVETAHPRMPVASDGEVCDLATPLRYRIRPRALRVIVPRTEAGTS
jgi:YegS/Rv2252/BmrU family lipid kinase